MDNLTKEQRHKNMQAIKSKDTSIEVMLRKALWRQGIRYRKNYSKLVGKPDIVITKYKIAIFCDSEFWHGFDWSNAKLKIKSNQEYWIPKIEKNIARDQENNQLLLDQGWIVIRLWEKEIRKTLPACVGRIKEAIERRKNIGE
ncbi:very short patch repair endonuclease [Desulfosporosinus nitroreducens]|uniref:Very short patch repair endonuclease n=1 Tax=Desulfosporosinus nitroreducens TaxID=2018668 RepID=A0ABT8QWZ5_9FIRM|nr:very short patch repair endonuclease [Desulfosporosinus nitroreducens]MDO0825863.1 very short patch repair endonuclease [Desulfosporosinus nitroreducens]